MAHFRIMYIHILLLYIQYWCLHVQCFYFFSSEWIETNGEGLDQSETATQRWGGLTAHLIGWSSSTHTHTHARRRRAGRGVCCSWKVHDSLICLWPRGSRTPRLFTQCGLILSRFGPSGVKVRTLGAVFTRFYRTRNIRGVSGDTKQKETSNFHC